VTWAATGRSGGVSGESFTSLNLATHVGDQRADVMANRERVRSAMGVQQLIVLSAVHGNDAVIVDGAVLAAADEGIDPIADALLCDIPDIAVMALGADCLTMVIAGDDGRTVGAVHCGWRGLAVDVVGRTLDLMIARDVQPAHIILGPAICGACYPVAPERVEVLAAERSREVVAASVVTCADGQPGIDVREGVRARLRERGVADNVVAAVGGCTHEDPDLFSYRRDGRTGRQGMVIGTTTSGRMSP
jgi:YfiH family protein